MALLTHSQVDALSRALPRAQPAGDAGSFSPARLRRRKSPSRSMWPDFSATNMRTRAVDAILTHPAYGSMAKALDHVDDFLPCRAELTCAYYRRPRQHPCWIFNRWTNSRRVRSTNFSTRKLTFSTTRRSHYHSSPNSTLCQLNLARRRKFSSEERALLGFLQPHLRQRYQQVLASAPSSHPALPPIRPIRQREWLICRGSGKSSRSATASPRFSSKLIFPSRAWSRRTGKAGSKARSAPSTQADAAATGRTTLPRLLPPKPPQRLSTGSISKGATSTRPSPPANAKSPSGSTQERRIPRSPKSSASAAPP